MANPLFSSKNDYYFWGTSPIFFLSADLSPTFKEDLRLKQIIIIWYTDGYGGAVVSAQQITCSVLSSAFQLRNSPQIDSLHNACEHRWDTAMSWGTYHISCLVSTPKLCLRSESKEFSRFLDSLLRYLLSITYTLWPQLCRDLCWCLVGHHHQEWPWNRWPWACLNCYLGFLSSTWLLVWDVTQIGVGLMVWQTRSLVHIMHVVVMSAE